MEPAKILDPIAAVIKTGVATPEKKAVLLTLMRQYIVAVCSDYNKISECIYALRSASKVTQNIATSGHDLVEVKTGSKIEHKHSYIKTTQKKPLVNAQLTFKLKRMHFIEVRGAREGTLSMIDVNAGKKSFSIAKELWEKVESELGEKMSGPEGGFQVDWDDPRHGECHGLFLSSLVYRLEVARWLHKISDPIKKLPQKISINLGGRLCAGCKRPHRLSRLKRWSCTFKERGFANDLSLEKSLLLFSESELEEFYTASRLCK